MLGKEMDKQLQEYVKSLREVKTVVNSSIVVSAPVGIVKSHDSGLLESNGGHIKCTKQWAKHFLSRMGYVKHKATTKASISDVDFEAKKEQYHFDYDRHGGDPKGISDQLGSHWYTLYTSL